jgi:hypothetical protein
VLDDVLLCLPMFYKCLTMCTTCFDDVYNVFGRLLTMCFVYAGHAMMTIFVLTCFVYFEYVVGIFLVISQTNKTDLFRILSLCCFIRGLRA